MKKLNKILQKAVILGAIILFGFTGSAVGQNLPSVALSLAKFNVLKENFESLEWRLEYRGYNNESIINPIGGVMFNTSGAYHVFAGIMTDINLFGNIYFTPSFAPGLYAKGHSKDLSFALEFRSQIELTYLFDNGTRLGINLNHISNGGLRLPNVGVESFGVTYVLPFSLAVNFIQ